MWDKLEIRLMSLFTDSFNNRKNIFDVTYNMINQYVLSNTSPSPYGSGPGTFETVFQFEINTYAINLWHSWAHNDYLEFLLTFGIPGSLIIFILLIVIIACCLANLLYSKLNIYCAFSLYSIIGILVHALADFPFQVYSICLVFTILIAVNFEINRLLIPQSDKNFIANR